MLTKYCVNCEEPCDPSLGDFCSKKCSDEFEANCDPDLLSRAQESNPDALPLNEPSAFGIKFGQSPRSMSGHLPPSTLDAVQSLLRIGGVSQEAIDNVVNIENANKAAAIDKQMAEVSQEDVKDNSQNE